MLLTDKISHGHKTGNSSGGVFTSPAPQGFTLVELLVAMAIMTIVAGAALVIFRGTAEHEARQQDNLQQMEELRSGFTAVANDVRRAGNGFNLLGTQLIQVFVNNLATHADTQTGTGWFQYNAPGVTDVGVVPIYGTDSGVDMTKADTLTIFHSDAEAFNPIGRLSNDFQPGNHTTLVLQDAVIRDEDIEDGDIIALSSGTVAVILQVSLPTALPSGGSTRNLGLGNRFRPTALMTEPANYTFPAGSSIFNFKNVTFVTYYLDVANRNLMANYHDTVTINGVDSGNTAVVANNIEDFQVSYYIAPAFTPGTAPSVTPPAWSNLMGGTDWTVGVIMGMISRSNRPPDAGLSTHGIGDPVELLGHTASTEKGVTRRVMVENINIRTVAPQ